MISWMIETEAGGTHVAKTGSDENSNFHNVENGATEVPNELDDGVLLLGGELIEAGTLAATTNVVVTETLLDVGVVPLLGDFETLAGALLFALPELPLGRSLLLVIVGGTLARAKTNGRLAAPIAIGGNVSHEVGVLVIA